MKSLSTRTIASLATSALLHLATVGILWAAAQLLEDWRFSVHSGQPISLVLRLAADPQQVAEVRFDPVEQLSDAPPPEFQVQADERPRTIEQRETEVVIERGELPPPRAAVPVSPQPPPQIPKVAAAARQMTKEPLPPATPRRPKEPTPKREVQPPAPLATANQAAIQFETSTHLGAIDEQPRSLPGNQPPAYPAAALAARQQGRAIVRVVVRADGTVGAARLEKSSGVASLDAAALAAVKSWRFAPARRVGVAVESELLAPFDFVIR